MKELQALIETYIKAVFEKDIEVFLSMYDEQVLVFDMWQQWSYKGIAAWREMVKGWFNGLGSDKDIVTFDEVQIQQNDELAIITAIVKFTATSEKGEALRYLQNRLTWITQHKDSSWKVIHQHTSSPIDFESMKVILEK